VPNITNALKGFPGEWPGERLQSWVYFNCRNISILTGICCIFPLFKHINVLKNFQIHEIPCVRGI
jgi:hypothetical protein